MTYIWINPVTDSMYDPAALDAFLKKHGYKRVEAYADWLDSVKEKYRSVVKTASRTVIDMRCPKIIELINEYDLVSSVTIPNIEPILIHCGREISQREDLRGEEKIITTPCQALADIGNSLGLKETRFLPWDQLILSAGGDLAASSLQKSPIPPGFFDGFDCETTSVTGEEEIRKYFKNFKPDDVQLAEMLFCKEGCHNGDGVRMCEME